MSRRHILRILRGLVRGSGILLHLCYGMVLAIAYPYLDPKRQRLAMKTWSRQLLTTLEIDIRIHHDHRLQMDDRCLILANHTCWLDIFVLNSLCPSRLVARSELRNWPVIGWLSHRWGTIFVEHPSRQNVRQANRQIRDRLRQGECIALFPEGSRTDGQAVGHFHSALIQSAMDSGARLRPVAMRYRGREGDLRFLAPVADTHALAMSLWQLVRCPHVTVLISFIDDLAVTETNRLMLARNAQSGVALRLQELDLEKTQSTRSPATPMRGRALLSTRSAFSLLVDSSIHRRSE